MREPAEYLNAVSNRGGAYGENGGVLGLPEGAARRTPRLQHQRMLRDLLRQVMKKKPDTKLGCEKYV